jgi:hydrogenase expression/formation protein HypE
VTSMHDPTEGGLATALWELAEASDKTIESTTREWPVLPDGAALCAFYGLDPLGAIASGALLLTVTPSAVERVMTALHRAGIHVYRLGQVLTGPPQVHSGGDMLPRPARDEIARLFE